MANNLISMSKIRQIIRMYTQGKSKLSIAASADVSRNTAKKYIQTFIASRFTFDEINELSDKELEDLFGKSNERAPDSRLVALRQYFPFVDKELKKKGMTRQILWDSYRQQHKDGFHYTQFCFYYNQWKAQVNPVMHVEHKAGDKMFVDYAGEKLCITDADTQQFYLSWQDNDIMFTGGQIYSSKDADSANASMLILDNGKYQVTLHLKRSGSGIVYDNSDGSYFEFKKSQATLCYSNNIGVGDLQIVDSALDVKSGQMRYKGRYYIAAFPLYDLAGKPNTVQGSFLNMALLAN